MDACMLTIKKPCRINFKNLWVALVMCKCQRLHIISRGCV